MMKMLRIFYLLLGLVMVFACNRSKPVLYTEWMSALADTVRLCSLSVPGTHNSAADCGFPFVKCQQLSVSEQLEIGIRAFDIRLKSVNGELQCYHADFSLGKTWRDVLADFTAFLREHPRESLLLLVKQEGACIAPSAPFDSLFYRSIQPCSNQFYLQGGEIPTLGKVRGKIVLLRRFVTDIIPLGSYIPVKNNTFTLSLENPPFLVQDCYAGHHLFNRNKKWKAVRSLIPPYRDAFLSELGHSVIPFSGYVFNFASGTGYIPPQWLSKYVNKKLCEYLECECLSKINPNHSPAPLGIFLLDFAGIHSPELIRRMILRNESYSFSAGGSPR